MEEATVLRDATLYLEAGVRRGDLLVVGEWIRAVGEVVAPAGAAERELDGCRVLPGLVDLQLNGFAGSEVYDATPEALRSIVEALPRGGCTSVLLTMISAPRERYERLGRALRALDGVDGGARILGLHLEGPYLNPEYAGAHPMGLLREPNVKEAEEMLEAAAGRISLWTLAPELPGADKLVPFLVSRQVLVAAGHSGLSYDNAVKWFGRGVSLVTHLFNAMPALHHRAPGLAAAALLDGDVRFSLIVDGRHVGPEFVRLAARLGEERLILVTDAASAAEAPDGEYRVAGEPALSEHGEVRRPDGRLAGSTLTAFEALQNFCAWTGSSLADALPAATSRPADLIGRSDVGRLAPGAFADFLVLGDGNELRETWVGGRVACVRETA